MNRRTFLGSVSALASTAWSMGCEEAPEQGSEACTPVASTQAPGSPLAVAMWDFSWLTRRWGQEAEFADVDEALDGLVERGYDCIRLDAFPHLIAADQAGVSAPSFEIIPQPELFTWGNHTPVQVTPKEALVEILTKMRARNLRVGLSSWFVDDQSHRAGGLVTPTDFARLWGETLSFLEQESFLDMVEWVDLCNEFPLPQWSPYAYEAIFGTSSVLAALNPWSDQALGRMQTYLDESIGPLRVQWPDLQYTFSVAAQLIGTGFRRLDTSSLDLIEPHIWLTGDEEFGTASGQLELLLLVRGSLEKHVAKAPSLYFERRDHWLEVLRKELVTWADWARARALPIITTEGWGPVVYDDVPPLGDTSEWDWIKDVCREGVLMARELQWKGMCSSNFTEPHFEGMWRDTCWHQEMTSLIRSV